MRRYIELFIAGDHDPEFWAYYGAYDWFLFTRLWGFMDMPKTFPKLCLDLKQYQAHLGIDSADLPAPYTPEHHALVDARWNRAVFQRMRLNDRRRMP